MIHVKSLWFCLNVGPVGGTSPPNPLSPAHCCPSQPTFHCPPPTKPLRPTQHMQRLHIEALVGSPPDSRSLSYTVHRQSCTRCFILPSDWPLPFCRFSGGNSKEGKRNARRASLVLYRSCTVIRIVALSSPACSSAVCGRAVPGCLALNSPPQTSCRSPTIRRPLALALLAHRLPHSQLLQPAYPSLLRRLTFSSRPHFLSLSLLRLSCLSLALSLSPFWSLPLS